MTPNTHYSGGKGTISDPYQLSTVNDWLTLISNHTDWHKHFVLVADINFAGAELSPIGTFKIRFTGTLDGNEHSLRNALINQPTKDDIGLFGVLGYGGLICNLSVENVAVTGCNYVGGLVGWNTGAAIVACHTTGSVTGIDSVGGLVGENYCGATITMCYTTGAVTGNNNVGGLVGSNEDVITLCYTMGAVNGYESIGRLVGSNNGTVVITSSCEVNTVSNDKHIDDLIGKSNRCSIGTCCSNGTVIGDNHEYKLVGKNTGHIVPCRITGTTQYKNSNPSLVSENTYSRDIVASKYSGGSGAALDPWQLSCVTDWLTLVANPDDWDKHFVLITDIDCAGSAFTPVGNSTTPFTGVVDGGGHMLLNAVINLPESHYVGLFGILGAGGVLRNLGVENVTVTGNYYVGGLVGVTLSGSIKECYATGAVTGDCNVGGLVGYNDICAITSCYAMCVVKCGAWNAGGLVGYNYGSAIMSCYATGAVTGRYHIGGLVGSNDRSAITSSYASGAVVGVDYIGGLVGVDCYSATNECFSTGAVTGEVNVGGMIGCIYKGATTSSYATGEVTGHDDVSGLVGHNDDGVITSCYATGVVTGNRYVGGLVGRNDGAITSSYSTVAVTGNWWVGGLVGYTCGGSIVFCYATGSVMGSLYIGGLNGHIYKCSITGCYSTGAVTRIPVSKSHSATALASSV